MITDQNKATSRRLIEEGINKNNWAVITETQDAKFVDHQPTPPGFPTGPEGFKQFLTALRTAFPDFRYTIDDQIAEGDKVVSRVTGHGTMKGAFAGMPATGKHAEWTEIHISRFTNNKVVEHWGTVDQAGMFQQLGVTPAAIPIPA